MKVGDTLHDGKGNCVTGAWQKTAAACVYCGETTLMATRWQALSQMSSVWCRKSPVSVDAAQRETHAPCSATGSWGQMITGCIWYTKLLWDMRLCLKMC